MAQMLPFETTIAIKAMPDDYNGAWVIDGPVGSDERDYDGETMEPEGVWKGMDMFDLLGKHVDYEHQYRKSLNPRFLIGVGLDRRLEKGVCHLRAELFKNKELAKSLWEHLNTKTAGGDNGYAGYSIEGRVLERDPKDRNIIKGVEVHRVTVSMSPKGFGKTRVLPVNEVLKAATGDPETVEPGNWVAVDEWDAFTGVLTAEEVPIPRYSQVASIIKAYVTGSGIATPASGDATPMREQSLIAPPTVVVKSDDNTGKPVARKPISRTKPTLSKPKPAVSTKRDDSTEKAIALWSDWLTSRGMDARLARVIHNKLEKTYA